MEKKIGKEVKGTLIITMIKLKQKMESWNRIKETGVKQKKGGN